MIYGEPRFTNDIDIVVRLDERQARSAADAVGGGRVQVQPVRVGRSTLYRARVVGMTQGGAQQACGRVRGPCIVLSPDAQG